jgi:hypothetical protein
MPLRVIPNKASAIPVIEAANNHSYDLAYRPPAPLPIHGSLYICGAVNSGKTNLITALLLSHRTKKHRDRVRYYYNYFDDIQIISGSLQTLPTDLFGLDPGALHPRYNEDMFRDVLKQIEEEDNGNSLIILDDVIDDLNRSKPLTESILNRRHICQNGKDDVRATLSVWITSQKYNLLQLKIRSNMSHVAIFRTSNEDELKAIRKALMADLPKATQDKVLELAWSVPYGFLFIDTFSTDPQKRYYANFSLIKLDLKSDGKRDE